MHYLKEIKDSFIQADGAMPKLRLKELESKVGFFVHIAMTFPVMFLFLKGFYLTMILWWRQAREENGWKMLKRAHAAYMADGHKAADGDQFNQSEDAMAPDKVLALLLLLEHLDTLMELMADDHPALRLIRGAKEMLEVLYIFGDASGAGFGSSWTKPGSDDIGYWYGI